MSLTVSISSYSINPLTRNSSIYFTLYTSKNEFIVRELSLELIKKYNYNPFICFKCILELIIHYLSISNSSLIDMLTIYYNNDNNLTDYLNFNLINYNDKIKNINIVNEKFNSILILAYNISKYYYNLDMLDKVKTNKFEIHDFYVDDSYTEDYLYIDDGYFDDLF